MAWHRKLFQKEKVAAKKIEKDEVKKEEKKRRDPEVISSLEERAILVCNRHCPFLGNIYIFSHSGLLTVISF